MATILESSSIETTRAARRPYFSAIRWGAIFAGVVSGTASYLLLALLGVAVGLTAINPQSAEPVGAVPVAAGIWTGISMLVGAFIGGYVAAHMSGLSRLVDGMLHGFVSWGATTLLYAVIMTSAVGAILGGTFSVLGSTVQGAAQVGGSAAEGQGGNIVNQLSSMIGGQGQINSEDMSSLQQALKSGNRQQATDILVTRMGMTQENASQTVDKAMPLFNPQQRSEAVRGAAAQATDVLSTASWWLFIGLLLSLAFGIAGGATGVKAINNRLEGDHIGERHNT